MKLIHIQSTTERLLFPVTVQEAKDFMRFDLDLEDELIQAFIVASTEFVESFTRRRLLCQAFSAQFETFKKTGILKIELPYPPLFSVESVMSQEGDEICYKMYGGPLAVPGYILADIPKQTDAIYVQFNAGYGSNASDVPERIRSAIKADVSAQFGRQYTKEDAEFTKRLVETYCVREFS